MRSLRSLYTLFIGIVLGISLVACGDRREAEATDETTGTQGAETIDADRVSVRTEPSVADRSRGLATQARDSLENTWENVADHAPEQREAFVAALDEGAREVDSLIAAARARLDNAASGAREGKEEALEELEEARDEFDRALSEARDASGEAWNSARAQVAQAWERLQVALNDYRAQADT